MFKSGFSSYCLHLTPAHIKHLIYGAKSYTLNYLQAGQSSNVCRGGNIENEKLFRTFQREARTDDRGVEQSCSESGRRIKPNILLDVALTFGLKQQENQMMSPKILAGKPMKRTDLRLQQDGVCGRCLCGCAGVCPTERSGAQVDEYLSWSRQTGSTFNGSAPF